MYSLTNLSSNYGRKLVMQLGNAFPQGKFDVDFVVEPHNWSIAADGRNIASGILQIDPSFKIKVTDKPYLSFANNVHFGSQFMFQNWLPFFKKDKNIIVTYFHGNIGLNPVLDKNLYFLSDNHSRVNKIIVSFNGMRKRLVDLGIPADKIIRIPIGVSTELFTPPKSTFEIEQIRRNLNIPMNIKVIGSFQKDGEGWGQGLSPKHIKGPDILLRSLHAVNNEEPVFVLLSGPSRGYVMDGLKKIGIPFKHIYANSEEEMSNLYRAIDLYLISSREEGGPKGLIEALSTGCPVVTTPVGMATDMNSQSKFFKIVNSYKYTEIASEILRILSLNFSISERINLRSHALQFDWKVIAKSHLNDVYAKSKFN